jgi:hypothetical protein
MALGMKSAISNPKERLLFPDCSHANGLAVISKSWVQNSHLIFRSRDLTEVNAFWLP